MVRNLIEIATVSHQERDEHYSKDLIQLLATYRNMVHGEDVNFPQESLQRLSVVCVEAGLHSGGSCLPPRKIIRPLGPQPPKQRKHVSPLLSTILPANYRRLQQPPGLEQAEIGLRWKRAGTAKCKQGRKDGDTPSIGLTSRTLPFSPRTRGFPLVL
jgi:hypothetical protein